MAMHSSEPVNASARRIVLVDFDWSDADLLPELLQQPGVHIRLVAGERVHDPGVRVAEMCGLPRTLDLADLTREIFDVALLGESSPRRTQLESLLRALGTPCMSPQAFLHGADAAAPSGIEAPLTLHAAAFEHALGGGDIDALLASSLPELRDQTPLEPRTIQPVLPPRIRVADFSDFPSREARARLEEAIKTLVQGSGAGTAELHATDGEHLQLLAKVGPEDRLLSSLIDLALELGTPQVVQSVSEPSTGRLWGAWPFRTQTRRGVLAAAAIEPQHDLGAWQAMVDDLRHTWDQEDRERASAAFPFTPEREGGWLEVEEFRRRLEMALERNRRDRLRFELHRLELPAGGAPEERLAAWLPGQTRDTDALCMPRPGTLLVLTAGPADGFQHLRRRLLALWEEAWRSAGTVGTVPALVDQHVALHGPEDAEGFLSAAAVWLTPR
jgi:hypothetical protein